MEHALDFVTLLKDKKAKAYYRSATGIANAVDGSMEPQPHRNIMILSR